RVLDADDRAAERKYGPIGDGDANLRQQINSGGAGEVVGDLGKPKRERRTEMACELKLVADRKRRRQLARRPQIKQDGEKPPERRLRERRGPKHCPWLRPQQFNEQRNLKHLRARAPIAKVACAHALLKSGG